MTGRAFLALVLALALTAPAAAAPGGLDTTFGGGDGRIAVPAAGPFVARAVTLDPTQRILVAGYRCEPTDITHDGTCLADGDSSFRLARFTPDGGLDAEFGDNGMVTTPVGVGRSQAFDLVVQHDGRIVVAGVARSGGRDVFAVVRYTTNGALDPTFGTGGIALVPVGSTFASAGDVALGPNGTLLLAGQAVDADGQPCMAVVRLTAAGVPDPAFGMGGAALGGGPFGYGTALAQGADGTIFVAGIAGGSADPATFAFGVLPMSPLGAAGPPVTHRLGSGASYANAVIALPGTGWLAAGAANDAGGRQVMAAARLTNSGALDPAYADHGVALRPVLESAVANDVERDAAGRALLIGQAAIGGGYDFASVRLRPNGTPDPGYGTGGTATVAWATYPIARGTAGAVQRDGKLVTVGLGCADGATSRCTGGTAVLLLARQLGGSPAPVLALGPVPKKVSRAKLRRGLHLKVRLRARARVDVRLMRGKALLARVHPKAKRATFSLKLRPKAERLKHTHKGALQLTVRAGKARVHRRITLR